MNHIGPGANIIWIPNQNPPRCSQDFNRFQTSRIPLWNRHEGKTKNRAPRSKSTSSSVHHCACAESKEIELKWISQWVMDHNEKVEENLPEFKLKLRGMNMYRFSLLCFAYTSSSPRFYFFSLRFLYCVCGCVLLLIESESDSEVWWVMRYWIWWWWNWEREVNAMIEFRFWLIPMNRDVAVIYRFLSSQILLEIELKFNGKLQMKCYLEMKLS